MYFIYFTYFRYFIYFRYLIYFRYFILTLIVLKIDVHKYFSWTLSSHTFYLSCCNRTCSQFRFRAEEFVKNLYISTQNTTKEMVFKLVYIILRKRGLLTCSLRICTGRRWCGTSCGCSASTCSRSCSCSEYT